MRSVVRRVMGWIVQCPWSWKERGMQDLGSNSNERTHRTHIGAHSLSSLTHGESVDVCAVWWMRWIQEKRENFRVVNVGRRGDMQSVLREEGERECVFVIRCVNAGVCGIDML